MTTASLAIPDACPKCGARGRSWYVRSHGLFEPGCLYCGWQDYSQPAVGLTVPTNSPMASAETFHVMWGGMK